MGETSLSQRDHRYFSFSCTQGEYFAKRYFSDYCISTYTARPSAQLADRMVLHVQMPVDRMEDPQTEQNRQTEG
ncbi:MAG: hypothetical protein ACLVJ6_17130 [Merdibacter sp.]